MDKSLALLGLLSVKPSYGYDLKQTYDRYFGSQKPLAFGQVYATLARHTRDALIVTQGEEPGGGPDRKRYEILPAGRRNLEQWLFTPDVPSQTMQSNLFAKTVVALLVDDDANRLLDLQRAQHMARMRELTRAKESANVLAIVMLDHALFHIEADLRWIETTSARLTEMKESLQ